MENMWISVKEGLPKDYTECIGYFPKGVEGSRGKPTVSFAISNGEKVYSSFPNSTAWCFEASHWMPLPLPPKDIDHEEYKKLTKALYPKTK